MAKCAFVSTNSICQGEQVGVIWPAVLDKNIEIFFAHKSFKWTNNARNNAGVTCVIVGIKSVKDNSTKKLINDGLVSEVSFISPYLVGNHKTIIQKSSVDPLGLPKLCFGCMPYDDRSHKYLRLNEREKQELIEAYPEASSLIRRIYGSEEFRLIRHFE